MQVRILLFGIISEIVGQSELKVDNIKTTAELKEHLFNRYPKLRSQEFRIAVNKKFVENTNILQPNDIVSLMPPFGGG